MLDHDQLTPEETNEDNQLLIRDLRRYYTTQAEDQASLEQIRARLLRQHAPAAPDAAASRLPDAALPVPTHTARNPGLALVPLLTWERPRRPYLTALIAAVLLIALVGSLTFFLNRQQVASQPPPAPHVAHGWTLVEHLSGTGTVTVTGKNIDIGHKYGWTIICTNNIGALVSVMFNGSAHDQGGITCTSPDAPATQYPDMSYSAPTPFAPIQSIKITTEATISWQFLLFTGTYYPPLSIPAGWQPLTKELDGTGAILDGGPFDLTLPQTWGLLFTCHGTGTIEISLQSGYEASASVVGSSQTTCDGQSNFNAYTGVEPGKQVNQIDIVTEHDNDWQLILVGCATGNPTCANPTSSVP